LADNDAWAADAAGLTGIWLDRSGTEPGTDGPTRITSLAELPGLLEELRRFGRAA
jgi:FMN phosphatase YigB (HAD superfamily)